MLPSMRGPAGKPPKHLPSLRTMLTGSIVKDNATVDFQLLLLRGHLTLGGKKRQALKMFGDR